MSSRYAIVDGTGLVTNVVLWDGNDDDWQPPGGQTSLKLDADSPIGPGWQHSGSTFLPPPPAPPIVLA